MKGVAGLGLAAVLALAATSAGAAARFQTQNNLKQLGVGVVLFELDYVIPANPTFDETDDGISGKMKVRKTGCIGDDCFVDVVYFTEAAGGGLAVFDVAGGLHFSAGGQQLFAGSLARPAFETGRFTFSADRDGGPIDAVLTSAAVPEPSTWALAIAGFGLAGGALRRRRMTPAAAKA